MVDDDNQPLLENIPTPAEEGQDALQFFSTWEHSGDCYHCLAGGRKHKACLSLYTDMKPTIQQLFEMFFFKIFSVTTLGLLLLYNILKSQLQMIENQTVPLNLNSAKCPIFLCEII